MHIGRSAIVSLTLAAAAPFAVATAQQAPEAAQAAPVTKSVTLPYSSEWVDGQVDVATGDRLTLTVTSALAGAVANPQGNPELSSRARYPEHPYGAVIARIGDNPPFLVGSSWSNDAPAAGHLMLAVNMTPSQQPGQTALFTVAVEAAPRVREAETQPDANNMLEGNAGNALDEPGNGVATPRNEVGSPRDGGGGEGPDWSWIVPWLLGAGGIVLLLSVAAEAKRRLGRGRGRSAESPPPTTPPLIRPSLDCGEGGVAGDEIEAAGPDVRLGATLEPGGTFFDGNEPEVRDE